MKRILSLSVLAALAASVLFVGCQQKGDIKIGAILPLSGPAAAYGQSAKNAIDLAVDQLNSKGGIRGRKLMVVYEDDQATPDKGVAAFTKLVTIDKVPVVMGAMPSSVTLAIAPVAERNKVVLFSPASSSPQLTNAGDYIFRNDVSDIFEGGEMAKAAIQKLGLKKVAIIYINNDYGVGIKDAFSGQFVALGGQVTDVETFDQNATDFRAQLAKTKRSDPDAIYIVGYKEQIPLLKQYKELGIKARVLGTIMFEDPEILKQVGDVASGVVYTYRAYDAASDQKEVKDFVASFKSKYGTEPDNWAAQSYDALNIVALAIKTGGYTAEGVKSALYKVSGFPGVSGTTSFDQNGDVTKPIRLKTVRNGAFVNYQ